MTWKFFISYSRSVRADIRPVINRLKKEGHLVWWDADIPYGMDWWATILDKIEWCDVFIFMVSEKAVQSPYCMAELRYGIARNRPVLPFVMDDHKQYTLPPEITSARTQYFKYDDNVDMMYDSIASSCQMLNFDNYPGVRAVRPPEPNKGAATLIKQFQQAVILAEDGQFDEAIKRFRNVASLDPAEWREDCHEWETLIQSYRPIAEMTEHRATLKRARRKWAEHKENYGEEFDPLGIIARLVAKAPKKPVSQSTAPPVQPPVITPVNPAVSTVSVPNPVQSQPQPQIKVTDILPAPFEWCNISAGDFIYGGDGEYDANKQTLYLPDFKIAKYPLTYAQYQVFLDDKKGFYDARWWQGLADGQPDAPDEQQWKIKDHPRENVSWYDAMAFCRWLSWKLNGAYAIDRLSEWQIRLPTEFEWEKAARGTDGREYPYGNTFDAEKANIKKSGHGRTTSVTAHATGASPYDVYDMSGNVWEWCLTDFRSPQMNVADEDISSDTGRVLRGGSFNNLTSHSRCAFRDLNSPLNRYRNLGFRLVCAPKESF